MADDYIENVISAANLIYSLAETAYDATESEFLRQAITDPDHWTGKKKSEWYDTFNMVAYDVTNGLTEIMLGALAFGAGSNASIGLTGNGIITMLSSKSLNYNVKKVNASLPELEVEWVKVIPQAAKSAATIGNAAAKFTIAVRRADHEKSLTTGQKEYL